jgi:hypothetical protein
MTGILNALIAGVSGAVKDTYFNLVSLLLPGNGTNGATNNSFVDSSTANSGTGWPITRNGDTTQGTFSPFSQTGWGGYFNGSSRLSSASGSVIDFGSNNFTVEMWVYLTSSSNNMMLLEGPSDNGFQFYVETGVLKAGVSGGSVGPTYTLPSTFWNSWNHIAVVRSGTGTNQTVMYVNGSAVSTNTISASTSVTGFQIARTSGYTLYGYVSNVRIIKNQALFSGNFTPSILPLTTTSAGATGANVASSITGTVSLLTCQSNRFIDNSGTVSSITVSGTAITPFSPFAPTSSYSAAAVGGSGYFDGSGDYLSGIGTTSSFNFMHNSTAAFTFECWVYPTVLPTSGTPTRLLFANQQSSGEIGVTVSLEYSGGNVYVNLFIARGVAGAWVINANSTSTIAANTWTHIAITYDQSLASANAKFYINGVSAGTGNKTANAPSSSNATYAAQIGAFPSLSGYDFAGYISGLRIINSVQSISLPTAPPTAVSGTQLLTNFTNAGVVDATAKNVLETEGNAQISTAIAAKFGSGSIRFPQSGTNDYLSQPLNDLMRIGSGDYTFECWVYRSNSNDGVLLSGRTGVGNNGMIFGVRTDKIFMLVSIDGSNWGINTYVSTQGNSVPTTTWSHVAISRQGSSWRVFIDGTLSYTSTLSGTVSQSGPILIGYDANAAAFTGYLDDVRITRYARYVEGTGGNAGKMVFNGTNTLALPTAPFPLQ